MTIQRPLGPIGHCTANLRRALDIEEEEALGRTIRVKQPAKDRATAKTARGGRWARGADFSIPGAFHNRFVSAEGKVAFHFSVQSVSKTADGGCRISTPTGSKRLTLTAPSEHDVYIERLEAVMTIEPAAFDSYAERQGAVETIEQNRAIRSNIAPTQALRQRYWRAVHANERTPGPDRVTLTPENVSRGAWQRLAHAVHIPSEIREIAADFAKPKGKRKTRTVTLEALGMDRKAAKELVAVICSVAGCTNGKGAVARLSMGRGGRSQYRLTAELPEGLDAVGRLSAMNAFCDKLEKLGFMYVAAIHAPVHHNDRRNYHLHIAFHDRPARLIGDRWDFEITREVPGQHRRVCRPARQLKIAEWSRDPEGGDHRSYASETIGEMRELFADLCNAELDRLGMTRKLDPGSLKSLGSERTPQKPLGTRAAPLEAAGVPTATGISNAEVLWSAVLREVQKETERRARLRKELGVRIADAEQKLLAVGSIDAEALAFRLHGHSEQLRAAALVLDSYEGELAEYDATLAMARARPNKALDTCRNILAAIDQGKASSAEQRARPAIVARELRRPTASSPRLPRSTR